MKANVVIYMWFIGVTLEYKVVVRITFFFLFFLVSYFGQEVPYFKLN